MVRHLWLLALVPLLLGCLSDDAVPCATDFRRRELREPYQRYQGEARYTLSGEELDATLAAMGISSLCVPEPWGAPFVNVDWNEDEIPAAEGRMLSLGFEDLYDGTGWSKAFVVYSTYDFALGTEYDRFGDHADWEALRTGSVPDGTLVQSADGVQAIVRLQPSQFCMGTCTLYRVAIFPFEQEYVAVVYGLATFDAGDDWAARADEYLAESQDAVATMDAAISSLDFTSQP